jgi:transposase
MGMGRRKRERQQDLWVATASLPDVPQHVFYEALNRLLDEHDFDRFVEDLCERYYAANVGRDSIPPGLYFRMLFVGYFEEIESQRGIAWRCADSRSLRSFLFLENHESSPDHSSLSRISGRLPLEVYEQVFCFVLGLAEEHKLLANKTVAVDSTYLEANAAMKSIVRKETGEDWKEYVKQLAEAEGIEIQNDEDLRKYDKKRKNKKVSNDEWESPDDPDSRIMKLKDGRTHLAYKAEHTIDLESEFLLDATVYHGNAADTATLTESLSSAQKNLEHADVYRDIEEVVADKGYHANGTLADCREWGLFGVRTYIPEPGSPYERRWTNKPPEHKAAVYANRRRMQRDRGKRLQKKRSELVERSFAHICETGGARRSWLRGLEQVNKRYKMVAAARNLGLMMRKVFGIGKPRCLQDGFSFAYLLHVVRTVLRTAQSTPNRFEQSKPSPNTKFRPAITAI